MGGDGSPWRGLAVDPGRLAGKVLDVRPAPDFRRCHLAGAVSWPLGGAAERSTAELQELLPSILLPPREAPLLVVAGDAAAARALAKHLTARGRSRVSAFAWPDVLPAGDAAIPLAGGPGTGALWEPPAWLRTHRDLLPPPAAGPVLDLGCGNGRAAVHLAGLGYRVTGLDRQPEALDLGRRLAALQGVACRFLVADLRSPQALPPGPWAAVLAFRYLQRELLPLLPRLVVPGGVVLLRTFREAPGYVGHPQPRHRLVRGEWLRRFASGEWEILAHEESFDPDGRPAAGVVARRRRVGVTSAG